VIIRKISRANQYWVSAFAVCLLSALCFSLSAYISSEIVAFILLLTLSLVAMFFDIFPVLLSALLSALIWDFFFLAPRFNFQVGNTEDKIMLSMYFVIALINAVLTFKIRQYEKAARQKEEKAKALQLYNTVLNSLSHEFRTPIAAIIGATDNLMASPPRLSESHKKNLLSEISSASLRLNRQVENLLNVSRLESGFIQPQKNWCDINEMVCDVIRQLETELENHVVEIHMDENLPLFKLDYGLMEQVLYNLLNNAAHYTPQRSRIMISADCLDDVLMMMVEDNGKGFPEKETEKVFEKFYRLPNSAAGGTGLGLSIVKGFVEAHRGTISLKKSETGGAQFVMKIPAEKIFA